MPSSLAPSANLSRMAAKSSSSSCPANASRVPNSGDRPVHAPVSMTVAVGLEQAALQCRLCLRTCQAANEQSVQHYCARQALIPWLARIETDVLGLSALAVLDPGPAADLARGACDAVMPSKYGKCISERVPGRGGGGSTCSLCDEVRKRGVDGLLQQAYVTLVQAGSQAHLEVAVSASRPACKQCPSGPQRGSVRRQTLSLSSPHEIDQRPFQM